MQHSGWAGDGQREGGQAVPHRTGAPQAPRCRGESERHLGALWSGDDAMEAARKLGAAFQRAATLCGHATGPNAASRGHRRIEFLNRKVAGFWKAAHGWAPIEAAGLLSKARLDWQVSLSSSLRLWLRDQPNALSDGDLILAWTNLGALIEGTLKLFLSVYYDDFRADV